MKQPRIHYDHLDIGDRLLCVLTANVHEITRPVRYSRGDGNGHFTLCTSPTSMCFHFSDGTEIAVETLDGTVDVAIDPGTQSGTILRQRGLGVTHLRGRGRGDLHVHVQVATPEDLTDREVELLSELAAIRGEHLAPPERHKGVVSRIRSAFS